MRLRRLDIFALVVVLVALVAALLIVGVLFGAAVLLPQEPVRPIPTAEVTDASAPETREIMFTSNRDGDWDIYMMSLSDRSVTNLTNNDADDGFGSYSADGGAITFLSNRDGILNPFMMNADGGNQRAVANDLPTILSVLIAAAGSTGISPTGGRIETVFVSLRDLNLEVYVQGRQRRAST